MANSDLERVIKMLESQDYLGNSFIPGEPSDYYTYAGEIPWSDEFASDDDYHEELGRYKGKLGDFRDSTGPIVEVLSHQYAWEDYHSAANRAGGCSVPSKSFSTRFGLTSSPSRFNQYDPNGKLAAISMSPPEGFDSDGNVLFIREELLRQYATEGDSKFVWAVWGERNLMNLGHTHPAWCHEIYQRNGHLWRRIMTLDSLAKP